MAFSTVIKVPTAFAPMAMSAVALLAVILHIAVFGLTPETGAGRPDEGPAAHIWQIMMACQLPVVIFFAIKWLRKDLRGTVAVLALQAGAYAMALVPVLALGY